MARKRAKVFVEAPAPAGAGFGSDGVVSDGVTPERAPEGVEAAEPLVGVRAREKSKLAMFRADMKIEERKQSVPAEAGTYSRYAENRPRARKDLLALVREELSRMEREEYTKLLDEYARATARYRDALSRISAGETPGKSRNPDGSLFVIPPIPIAPLAPIEGDDERMMARAWARMIVQDRSVAALREYMDRDRGPVVQQVVKNVEVRAVVKEEYSRWIRRPARPEAGSGSEVVVSAGFGSEIGSVAKVGEGSGEEIRDVKIEPRDVKAEKAEPHASPELEQHGAQPSAFDRAVEEAVVKSEAAWDAALAVRDEMEFPDRPESETNRDGDEPKRPMEETEEPKAETMGAKRETDGLKAETIKLAKATPLVEDPLWASE